MMMGHFSPQTVWIMIANQQKEGQEQWVCFQSLDDNDDDGCFLSFVGVSTNNDDSTDVAVATNGNHYGYDYHTWFPTHHWTTELLNYYSYSKGKSLSPVLPFNNFHNLTSRIIDLSPSGAHKMLTIKFLLSLFYDSYCGSASCWCSCCIWESHCC